MNRQIINETYALKIPDHFEILSGKDLDGMRQGTGDPFRWGVRDRENHMIIIALWKQYPALLSCMLDLKAVVKKNEQLTRKAHEAHGYRFLEFFSMQAGEEKAEGYRFIYEKEGVAQVCSNFLIKDGRTIYAFICIGREEHAEADKAVFSQIMEMLEYV